MINCNKIIKITGTSCLLCKLLSVLMNESVNEITTLLNGEPDLLFVQAFLLYFNYWDMWYTNAHTQNSIKQMK